jgi:hypothetical protein
LPRQPTHRRAFHRLAPAVGQQQQLKVLLVEVGEVVEALRERGALPPVPRLNLRPVGLEVLERLLVVAGVLVLPAKSPAGRQRQPGQQAPSQGSRRAG